MVVLVTGGAGYIGSHTCVRLLEEGYEVVVIDNLSNSGEENIGRIEFLTRKKVKFYPYDLCDKGLVMKVFQAERIDAVIHFAGLKAVGESVEKPFFYYHNNLTSTLNLLEAMSKYDVRKLVFSSSATVYGNCESVPICETAPLSATNPYGHTKLMQEQILKDLQAADSKWNFMILRYFNPVGGHETGILKENPKGIPNNLMPYIEKVAEGTLPFLNVFGKDYPTVDGTGVRDYIHVMDLADGHLAALKKMESDSGCNVYNLGTGQGYSVLQMVEAFSKVNDVNIPFRFTKPREGDVAVCFADTKKAEKELGWKAERSLEEMCRRFSTFP